MRRVGPRLVALLISVLAASAPLAAAAAPDLRSELLPPGGGGTWTEHTSGDAEGPMTIDDIAGEYQDSSYARGVLQAGGFESGYQRTWEHSSGQLYVNERAYLFGSVIGAGLWLGTEKGADRDLDGWKGSFDTSAITNSFGGTFQNSDGSYDTIVEFAPGDRVYLVDVSAPDAPQEGLALALAERLDAAAPREVLTSAGGMGLAVIGIVAGAIGLALVAVVVLVVVLLVRRSGRRAAPVYPAAQPVVSADGNWWWDGHSWQPVTRGGPATPPTSPGP